MKKDLITIDLNVSEVSRMIGGLAEAGKNTTPLMRRIAGTLASLTAQNFQDEGLPSWQPSVAAQKRAGRTLSDRGRLRQSITEDYDLSHARVGSNLEYAAIHQLGGTVKHKSRESKNKRKPGMLTKAWDQSFPARPFLPVDADGTPHKGLEENILRLATDFLRDAANGTR